MEDFNYKRIWYRIIKEQREKLVYKHFDRQTALDLALIIIKKAKTDTYGDVAIRIYEDDTIIFSYKMGSTGLTNDAWLTRKYAVTKHTNLSSMETLSLYKEGLIESFWDSKEDNFAPCGGCFPIYDINGRTSYTVLVSGLPHHMDHNLLVDSIAKQLNIKIDLLS